MAEPKNSERFQVVVGGRRSGRTERLLQQTIDFALELERAQCAAVALEVAEEFKAVEGLGSIGEILKRQSLETCQLIYNRILERGKTNE